MSDFADWFHAKRRVIRPCFVISVFGSLLDSFTALYSFICRQLYNVGKGGRAPIPTHLTCPLSPHYAVPCGFIHHAICQSRSEAGMGEQMCCAICLVKWFLKGQSNDAIHYRYVVIKTTEERLLKRALHSRSSSFNMTKTESSKKIDPD